MNIETINETINVSKVIGQEKKIKIVEGDIIVPDIKPDILSLISVDNEVYITKQSCEEGKIYVEGIMDVCAIYMSEDEKTSYKSLNNVFTFYETFNIEGVTENSIIDLKTYKGPTECKIITGRRVNIKSPVTLDVKVINNCEYNLAKDIVDDRNMELQKNNLSMNILCNCKKQDIELRENISLDENCPPIGEILKATIKISNEEFKISYNKILAKADATIKIIYVSDDEKQSLESFERIVPVMGFIDYEGINEEMDIKLEYNIKSFVLRPIYQDLKSLSFSIESDIVAKACVYQKKEVVIISDIYNPDMDINCEYEAIEIQQSIINEKQKIEIVQGLLIPDLDNIKILDIEANPNVMSKNVLDGKIALEGNIDFDILYCNEIKQMVENKKIELPFQQVVKIPSLQSGMNTEVAGIEYQKIDASKIQIKVILEVMICVSKQDYISGIKNINSEESTNQKFPSIVIYYIKPEDTLWNIAKKYKSTVKEIMEYNELKDDKIYPGEQLIIPRRTNRQKIELL